MLQIQKDDSFAERHLLFGLVEVCYPQPVEWDEAAFCALKERELAALFETFRDYDRKAVFGENVYYRYFKKYKKTYPVLQQLESILLKGRPFPTGRPFNEVAFLTELRTQVLSGAHDAEQVMGTIKLFCPEEKLPFTGMRGGGGSYLPRRHQCPGRRRHYLQHDRRYGRAHLPAPGKPPYLLSLLCHAGHHPGAAPSRHGALILLRPGAGSQCAD